MALSAPHIALGAVVDHFWETVNPRNGDVRRRKIVRRGLIERVDKDSGDAATQIYVKFRPDADSEVVPSNELNLVRMPRGGLKKSDQASLFSERESSPEGSKPVLEDALGLTKGTMDKSPFAHEAK